MDPEVDALAVQAGPMLRAAGATLTEDASAWPLDPFAPFRVFWDAGCLDTFVMIEGVLRITLDDGQVMEFGPGDTASFALGTHSTWEVVEPVLHFFIQTT